jgi:hypothetical protein
VYFEGVCGVNEPVILKILRQKVIAFGAVALTHVVFGDIEITIKL